MNQFISTKAWGAAERKSDFRNVDVLRKLRFSTYRRIERWRPSGSWCTTGRPSGRYFGGESTAKAKEFKEWGLDLKKIRIFADTDILSNPQVTQNLCCPENTQSLIYPPQKFISDDGTINYEKYSPDDWMEEGADREQVFNKRQIVHISSIQQYPTNIPNKNIYLNIDKSGKTKATLVDFFKENMFFVSQTGYVSDRESKLWEFMDLECLTYYCLKKYADRNWNFNPLQQALVHGVDTVTKISEIQKLFGSKNKVPFENGWWRASFGIE